MSARVLSVTLGHDRNGAPLASIQGLPGDDFDASSAMLRSLANALKKAADDLDKFGDEHGQRPAGRRYRAQVAHPWWVR